MKRFRFVASLAVTPLVVACGAGIPQAQIYATVYGRVSDAATDAPLAGVAVSVDSVNNVTTASDGTYRAINVPLGQVDVVVTPPSGYAVGNQGALNFSVTSGERYRLDIPLNRTR